MFNVDSIELLLGDSLNNIQIKNSTIYNQCNFCCFYFYKFEEHLEMLGLITNLLLMKIKLLLTNLFNLAKTLKWY